MNLNDLTIGEAKELAKLFGGSNSCKCDNPYHIGENYFIRTVTMIQIGKLIKVTDKELVLEDAIWVADTGRFADALEKGNLDEVEPFPAGEVIVGRGAIIDACIWSNDIVRERK